MISWPNHPPDCPNWEYEDYPEKKKVLPTRVAEVLRGLVSRHLDTRRVALDTREAHEHCFRELTPLGCEYYAGHYRGENYRCLLWYIVGIRSDPRVGCPPQAVEFLMQELKSTIDSGFVALDSTTSLAARDRLHYLIVITSRIFELFLRIHPFANGNGHAGRFIVSSILGRYGHWPRKWSVEPRPGPPYLDAITAYRNGDPRLLEHYLLSTLTG
jgi:fido (protein-threonine AMPylation protein)